MNKSLRKAYKFFVDNAGYVVGRHAMGALRLARAEQIAEHEADRIKFIWSIDEWCDRGPIDWGWSENDIVRWNRTDHECLSCALTIDGNVEASLSGIWDADAHYRRVIEAELLDEYLSRLPVVGARTTN